MFWRTLCYLLLLSFGSTAVQTSTNLHHSSLVVINTFANDEREIFDLVNIERTKSRLSAMEWSGDLAKIAREHSKNMARDGLFDHRDREGRAAKDRVGNAGISGWKKVGENIFLSYADDEVANIAVRGWMHSAGHRKNILDKMWTATRIGVAKSKDGRVYITQVFVAE